jgi:excinuclease ABC subunit C
MPIERIINDKIKDKLKIIPHSAGVYLMRDASGKILYIGKAKNLKKRVTSYFKKDVSQFKTQPKVAMMLDKINDLDFIEVKSEEDALVLESRLVNEWKPKHNTDLRDDKKFPLIQVDIHRALPIFKISRNRNDSRALYFGPFVHQPALHKILAEMKLKFGILIGDTNPQVIENGRYELYSDARSEIYDHPNEVSLEEYRQRVHAACVFLEGKTKEWLEQLQKDMQTAADAKDYEKAAEYRDLIFATHKLLVPTRKFTRNLKFISHPQKALEGLKCALQLETLPIHMECFDISHISGTFVVASMVHFNNGKPDKKEYRRYKIRSFVGNDDFRAMEEVVERRYARLNAEGRALPDLIVIDGGKGQIGAALKAFANLDIAHPPLIGLAKKQETILFADDRDPINLPANDPALRLLQQLRDEAHRFANTFNATLRSKRIRESILDDLTGLGQKRKDILLQHFKTITQLRNAPIEELQKVAGIGPKLATEVHEFLNTIVN